MKKTQIITHHSVHYKKIELEQNKSQQMTYVQLDKFLQISIISIMEILSLRSLHIFFI